MAERAMNAVASAVTYRTALPLRRLPLLSLTRPVLGVGGGIDPIGSAHTRVAECDDAEQHDEHAEDGGCDAVAFNDGDDDTGEGGDDAGERSDDGNPFGPFEPVPWLVAWGHCSSYAGWVEASLKIPAIP